MLNIADIADAVTRGTVVDLTPSAQFAAGHVPGSINIPQGMLAAWAGWLVDYDKPTFLICEPGQLEEAARTLHKIGVEEIVGGFDRNQLQASGLATEVYMSSQPSELASSITNRKVQLLDVRSNEEWQEGHIAQADHCFLGRLPSLLEQFQPDDKLVVQCQLGGRSAIAASVLQAAGFKNVVNMAGGYAAWKAAGLPSVKTEATVSVHA